MRVIVRGRASFIAILVLLERFILDTPTRRSDASRDLATLTFHLGLGLEVTALADTDLTVPSAYQVGTSEAFPFGRHRTFTA